MKRIPLFLTLLLAVAAFGFSNAPSDTPADDAVVCGSTILSGCVGTCGNGFSTSVVAPVSGFYCFDAVSSLCPTNGAKARVQVGSNTIFLGDVSGGTSFGFWAAAGQTIGVRAELFDKKSDIVCVWLGNVNITVRQP